MILQTKPRCQECRLHSELCICSQLPRLDTLTRVCLLMHVQERDKPSNTGRLAHLCLPNSEIRYRGLRDGSPLDLTGLKDEAFETFLLVLSEDSKELNPALLADLKRPVRLLVPDGTWSQASRLGSKLLREPSLAGVRRVKLCIQPGKPSEYRLRTEHHPDGMATFEAIARALGVLEGERGPEVQASLEKAFRLMNDRVLFMRGKLPAGSFQALR
jgi:DTW domain-containing protein